MADQTLPEMIDLTYDTDDEVTVINNPLIASDDEPDTPEVWDLISPPPPRDPSPLSPNVCSICYTRDKKLKCVNCPYSYCLLCWAKIVDYENYLESRCAYCRQHPIEVNARERIEARDRALEGQRRRIEQMEMRRVRARNN